MASESPAALSITGLHKAFSGHLGIGRHPAVRGVELEVRPGEIFGLLGPNGAGKTTTIKMILGLLRPDAGEIRVFGRPSASREARKRLGFLPENPYFYDYLTAREFLDFYARLQGIAKPDRAGLIDRTLERVGLAGRENTALRAFSKGMMQRLGLAQAIQHDPDLVILDEPMSGLDPIGRREVRDLILALREAGKTVFFSSHILQDAEMICDRVAILKQGELLSVGSLDELVSHRVRWFEVTVRGSLPPGVEAARPAGREGEHLVRVADIEALRELLDTVRAAGAQVVSVWPRRETLEDLFMKRVAAAETETPSPDPAETTHA
ncbi:MAG: ATP-binding cassette domain-containing protein [Acidobacteria bacterium]|nr:ATP-binding cassette domain-containing protein [Acidobacteriota bacterium]NIM61157.1 ATP-binding cassette domain-containing protein [Acidobacteriota bacterium]NIO58032.1 ATP-binding cassette domain-containing protein [Acidobacteriota bacterium]NIQ29039.1 ATP-binding cassette domain-containing protein [Acidobacteriota bacterium]NIQ83565.1 ATP-binding cassette domain-containing protein [Acidobacteriota bacterium]